MNYRCKGNLHYYTRWLILLVDDSIAEYYRHLIYNWNRRLVLQHPKHGAHITVIAGKYEYVGNHQCWKKYHNKKLNFNIQLTLERMDVIFGCL
jgi:hypothetical protein